MGFEPTSLNRKLEPLPPQHTGQSTLLKTNVVYIINCVWAAVCRNVGEVRQESSTPWHSKCRRWRTAGVKTL